MRSGGAKVIEKPKLTLSKSIIYIIIGIIGIILGADLVVNNASSIAIAVGMSETLVGLTKIGRAHV